MHLGPSSFAPYTSRASQSTAHWAGLWTGTSWNCIPCLRQQRQHPHSHTLSLTHTRGHKRASRRMLEAGRRTETDRTSPLGPLQACKSTYSPWIDAGAGGNISPHGHPTPRKHTKTLGGKGWSVERWYCSSNNSSYSVTISIWKCRHVGTYGIPTCL